MKKDTQKRVVGDVLYNDILCNEVLENTLSVMPKKSAP
jgi:hypothetical protein